MSYKCYEAFSAASKYEPLSPNRTQLEHACSVITQAIIDQFGISDNKTHISALLEEAIKLAIVQAHAQVKIATNGQGECNC